MQLGVTTRMIKRMIAAANNRNSRPRGQILSSLDSLLESPERVIPSIAADIHPATTLTEPMPRGQCWRISTNMPKYCTARSTMLQRQSRTRSKPEDVMKSRITATHASEIATNQGFLCTKSEMNRAKNSSVHMIPLWPSSTFEITLLTRPSR